MAMISVGIDCYHERMIRTQISLTDAQMARVRAEALRRGVSIAALVREGVDRLVRGPDWEQRRDAALAAVGTLDEPGITDVADHHDEYLAQPYGRPDIG
jgi:hypothetical protein